MDFDLTLASGSATRRLLLKNAGVRVESITPRVDEDTIRRSLEADGAYPRDVADTLAEMKAQKVAPKATSALTLGCDQVLAFGRDVMAKPASKEEAVRQLTSLSGQTHMLLSAVVLYENGTPVWRFVGEVRLTMRALSTEYINDYVTRNWDSIQNSVGAYKLEEEGARLFTRVTGDYFTVLGLPLIEVLSYLTQRGTLKA